MADSKITALTAITTVNPATYPLVIVDTSDTSMAITGTTKKVTTNQLLGSGGTATLASATITGDLTVATNGLKVDSANKNVGINTATPTNTAGYKTLEIVGTGVNTAGMLRFKSSDTSVNTLDFADINGRAIFAISNHPVRFGCNDIEQYRINPLGVFTWFDGAGGTRMTLNSTGLGVGGSPTEKLSVNGSLGLQNGGTQRWHISATSGSDLVFTRSTVADRFTITSDGNVGIGVTPSAWDAGLSVIELKSGSVVGFAGSVANYTSNAFYQAAWKYKTTAAAAYYQQANGTHAWFTAASGTAGTTITDFATARMTLDASGNLFVGKTATGLGTVGIQESPSGWIQATVSGDASLFTNRLASDGKTIQLYRQTLEVGNISVTTTGATFNSTSDYRLKEAVAPLSGGLARVNALKPSVYKWKSNGLSGEGFLAHELAEVVPAAVNGEKDDVNEDGSIKAQSIDMSRVVPILVAAIQELAAEVNALKKA